MGAQSLSLLLRYEARLKLAAYAADLVTLEPSFSKKKNQIVNVISL